MYKMNIYKLNKTNNKAIWSNQHKNIYLMLSNNTLLTLSLISIFKKTLNSA